MTDDIIQVEPGVFLSLENCQVLEARIDGDVVTVNGTRYQTSVADPRKWNPAGTSGQAQGRVAIKAPMPGKVVRVLVQVGAEVEAGQGVVVVEAMKMQNELKAARAGTVSEIHVRENDTVEANALLIVVE